MGAREMQPPPTGVVVEVSQVIAAGGAAFGAFVGAMTFLFKALLASKDEQIGTLRHALERADTERERRDQEQVSELNRLREMVARQQQDAMQRGARWEEERRHWGGNER